MLYIHPQHICVCVCMRERRGREACLNKYLYVVAEQISSTYLLDARAGACSHATWCWEPVSSDTQGQVGPDQDLAGRPPGRKREGSAIQVAVWEVQ